jgi:hypothetical protein
LATKIVDGATEAEIERNVECQFLYWLLIFPETVVLDNATFSGDPINIDPGLVGMEVWLDERKFCCTMIYWQVALKEAGWT